MPYSNGYFILLVAIKGIHDALETKEPGIESQYNIPNLYVHKVRNKSPSDSIDMNLRLATRKEKKIRVNVCCTWI